MSRQSSLFKVMSLPFVFMVVIQAVHATTFSAKIENSQWYLSSSIFECRLVHEIPLYGQAVFLHEAGEGLLFHTTTHRNPMKVGRAALVVEASDWGPGGQVKDLGYIDVLDSNQPLNVPNKESEVMIQGLLDGMTPTFTRKAWYSDETIRLKVSRINFMSVYPGYLDCIAGLLPVNFRQVEKNRVHFQTDKANLTDEDKVSLDNVVLYVSHDPSVTAIYVDGHTDNSGRRIYNRRLSKARAESVRDYLIQKGIPEDVIRTRYHGERYPVVKNSSKENKKLNRRTTVRLVREEE